MIEDHDLDSNSGTDRTAPSCYISNRDQHHHTPDADIAFLTAFIARRRALVAGPGLFRFFVSAAVFVRFANVLSLVSALRFIEAVFVSLSLD
jgi:hypothetical protein